jgi:hypothetical protein
MVDGGCDGQGEGTIARGDNKWEQSRAVDGVAVKT